MSGLEVPGREDVVLVDDVHEDGGPEPGQPSARDGVLPDLRCDILFKCKEPVAVGDGDPAASPGDDRFYVLRPHHGTDAPAAGGPGGLVDNTGEPDEALAGGADTGDACAGVAEVFLEGRRRLARRHPPQRRGIPDLRMSVVEEEGDRPFRPPQDHDRIVPGTLHAGAELPAGVRAGQRPGQRRLRDDVVPGAQGKPTPCNRPGGEDQHVLRAERIDARVHQILEDADPEASPSDICPPPLFRKRLLHRPLSREIDVEDLLCVAVHRLSPCLQGPARAIRLPDSEIDPLTLAARKPDAIRARARERYQ